MERKNPKQLRLQKDVELAAEKLHREWQVATGEHNLTFVDFGNRVMLAGINEVKTRIEKQKQKRKIRSQ